MISLIIPVYNAEKHIGPCLDALRRQSCRDCEILVIDDGSTDRTAERTAEQAALDPRIRLIRRENGGVSAARNTGIEQARGELLAFLDSDDSCSPAFLDALCALYAPGVLPVADVIRSDGQGSALLPSEPEFRLPENWQSDFFFGSLGQQIAFSVWNKLFCAETLKTHGIRFREEVTVGEDMLFVYSYLHFCDTVRVTREAEYYYLIQEGSAMNSARDYTEPYCRTLRAMEELNAIYRDLTPEILSGWALSITAIILTNPAVSNLPLASFRRWWFGFQKTPIYSHACALRSAAGRERSVLLTVIKRRRTLPLFLLLRAFRHMKKTTRWETG